MHNDKKIEAGSHHKRSERGRKQHHSAVGTAAATKVEPNDGGGMDSASMFDMLPRILYILYSNLLRSRNDSIL